MCFFVCFFFGGEGGGGVLFNLIYSETISVTDVIIISPLIRDIALMCLHFCECLPSFSPHYCVKFIQPPLSLAYLFSVILSLSLPYYNAFSLFVSIFLFRSIRPSVHPCMSVRMSVCLSISLCVCLSVYVFVCVCLLLHYFLFHVYDLNISIHRELDCVRQRSEQVLSEIASSPFHSKTKMSEFQTPHSSLLLSRETCISQTCVIIYYSPCRNQASFHWFF